MSDVALPVRPCPECRVYDDHPRHVVIGQDGSETALHMDCCAARGCQVCAHQLIAIGRVPGLVGDALRERLVALPVKQVEHADGNPYGAVSVNTRG